MLRDNRLRLLTLGRLTLVGSGGEEHESLAKRRRKLALLAVLAMARRPIARDTLVEMFWGAEDEARARHSLSNALSSLRRALGAAAIRSRDADVAIAADAPLVVDALELADAVEGREFGRAAELYAGPFLEGFFLDDSPTFDQWMSRERRRLEGLFVQACAQECAMLARARRWPEGHALARRWLDAQPLSPDAALMVLNTARAPGTRAALAQALEDYETLKSHLEREFDLPPETAVRTLAEQIREHLATIEPDPAPVAPSPPMPVSVADSNCANPAAPLRATRAIRRHARTARPVHFFQLEFMSPLLRPCSPLTRAQRSAAAALETSVRVPRRPVRSICAPPLNAACIAEACPRPS